MIAMTLAEIAHVVGGEVTAQDAHVKVTGPAFLDSRARVPGGLFVAVAGERVDGHDYVTGAVQGGAAAVLGSRPTEAPTVVVEDAQSALAALARHVLQVLRTRGELTVFAMTGSQGKTGTKDYLAAILSGVAPTTATRANHNNELGVPLTVLNASPDTRHLVIEMGARGIGHIRYLTQIAAPDVAAVLNVGTAHLGEFGSREAIAQAKGEIIESLTGEGTAVLNADDALVAAMAPRTPGRVRTFGAEGADVSHSPVVYDELGRASFTLFSDDQQAAVTLHTPGVHQVVNATAAAAMALAAGVPLTRVAAGLSAARPASPMRMESHVRSDGLLVINDAYNANLDSMVAALDTLALVRRTGRRIAVLGEMLELGPDHESAHRTVGEHAAQLGIDLVVTVGTAGDLIAEGTGRCPDWTGQVLRAAGREAAAALVGENVREDDVVLVKASRGVALENVVEALLEGTEPR